MNNRKNVRKQDFINIKPTGVDFGFNAKYKIETNGMYSWYIPSFDIYFSSEDKLDGDKRAILITRSFFNYWIKKRGYRSFILKILKLEFKPESHQELKNLLERTNLNANLKSKKIDKNIERFELSSQQTYEFELAI